MKGLSCGIVLILTMVALSLGCGDQSTRPSDLPESQESPNVLGAAGQSATLKGGDRNFAAPLSGRQEVPSVDSKGTGVATFKLSKDGSEMRYKLNVANIENVTQAHIHLAPAGQNGSVVAFLFGFVAGGVTVNGTLAEGTLTAGNLIGPLAGLSLDDLVKEMASGDAYVNVHTVAHPPGEIRGQVK